MNYQTFHSESKYLTSPKQVYVMQRWRVTFELELRLPRGVSLK